jgi:hypothetical protein
VDRTIDSRPQDPHVGSHTVPKCYLRRFANDQGLVRVFNRNQQEEPFITGIGNIAVERDFYALETASGRSQDIERRLGAIDGEACSAFARLSDGVWPVSAADREVLANFIALQITRGTRFRELLKEIANDMMRLAARAHVSIPGALEAIVGDDASAEDIEQFRAILREGRFDITPNQSASVINALRVAEELVPIIGVKRWNLVRTDALRIVTSDNPVTLWRRPLAQEDNWGVGVQTADEVALPVDSKLALVLRHPLPSEEESLMQVDLEAVRTLNSRTILQASRWVYAHPETLPS